MATDEKVYSVCAECKKQILTYLDPNGVRHLSNHKGRGQRAACPGSMSACTGLTPVHYCGMGCGHVIARTLPHCSACERWRAEAQSKIDGGS